MKKRNEDKLTLINFRDLGGLDTINGTHIKKGLIYRTAIFEPENDIDREFIKNMNLDCVIDLRSPLENAEVQDILPKDVELIHAPVIDGTGKFREMTPTKKTQNAVFFYTDKKLKNIYNLMFEFYTEMPYFSHAFSKIFECMNQKKTFAFHCTAGKDRTGVAAMLIELAFGRKYEDILKEYLYSDITRKEWNEYVMSKVNKIPFLGKKKKEYAWYAMTVHKELFDNAYNAIFDKYKTFQDFLEDVYHISKEQVDEWRKYYLE